MGWLTCNFEPVGNQLYLIVGPLPQRGRQKSPYVARLTGPSETFRLDRDFLPSRPTYFEGTGEFLMVETTTLTSGDLLEVRFGSSRDGRRTYRTYYRVDDPIGSGLSTVSRREVEVCLKVEEFLKSRASPPALIVVAGPARKLRTVQGLK